VKEFPLGGEPEGGFVGCGDEGGAGVGDVGLVDEPCAMLICNGSCSASPFASETVTLKLNVPAALGVPDTFPEPSSRLTPWGICPEVTANLYGDVPPETFRFPE